jgi:hypothetical protein
MMKKKEKEMCDEEGAPEVVDAVTVYEMVYMWGVYTYHPLLRIIL